MNISSILITIHPPSVNETLKSLKCINGLEIYHVDEDVGQVVVIQEANSVDDEVAGLTAIKALPNILYAEMVYHYFESQNNIVEAIN